MSYARRILPERTVMITRRVLRRIHLLRPDPEINAHYGYSLGVFAERYGMQVIATTVMSNHFHLVVTDTRGVLPDFMRDFHRTLALGIKQIRKWEGPVWDHEKSSVVELRTEQAVVEATGYCCGNPTEAGAVRRAKQWPGVMVLPEQLGRASWTVKRPDVFFDEANPQWPEVAMVTLAMPPLAMAPARFRQCVSDELDRIETDARLAAQEHGRRFLGRDKVLATSPYSRATSFEPIRHRNPTFAVGRGQREAFFEAVTMLREFRRAYREALTAWSPWRTNSTRVEQADHRISRAQPGSRHPDASVQVECSLVTSQAQETAAAKIRRAEARSTMIKGWTRAVAYRWVRVGAKVEVTIRKHDDFASDPARAVVRFRVIEQFVSGVATHDGLHALAGIDGVPADHFPSVVAIRAVQEIV